MKTIRFGVRWLVGLTFAVGLAFGLPFGIVGCGPAPDAATDQQDPSEEEPSGEERLSGLVHRGEGVAEGYVLFSPLSSGTTYLLNGLGEPVHTWQSDFAPHSLYLLPNGNLLRPGRDPDSGNFMAGGAMGLLEEFNWEGERIWFYKFSDDQRILHHDIEPLPNGNLLALGWEQKSVEEAMAVGRRPDQIPGNGLWPDFLVEIEPLPPNDARVVWEWRVWDHLVQNIDPALPNYGEPSDFPGRVDINALTAPISSEELEELKALGYVPESADAEDLRADLHHLNAVDWHPVRNELAMTSPSLSEVWIISRTPGTEEARGVAGDLLYRWGNPQVYGRGTPEDQQLFGPHDVQWIPDGTAQAGHLTIFNNGRRRPETEYSSVEQIVAPALESGYRLEGDAPYGPKEVVWRYVAEEPTSFFSSFISGAHRLPNGNTFITAGPQGRLFEVNQEGEVVWDFWNSFEASLTRTDGKRLWGGDGSSNRMARAVWRAEKLPLDHPGLAGRRLER